MRSTTAFVLVPCSALVLAAFAAAAKPGSGGGGTSTPAVAFQARPGSGVAEQLFLTSADGSTTVQLTNDGLVHLSPAWSPDGARIAFRGGTWAGHGVWSVKRDGTDRVLHLAADATTGLHPNSRLAWSPDGTSIAYTGVDNDLYLLDLATGTASLLLRTVDGAWQHHPTWSPDGARLAFSRFVPEHGQNDLFALELATGTLARLTNTPSADERMPGWSPDGALLVFKDDADGALWTMRADGTDRIRLLAPVSVVAMLDPTWSPDGRHVAFRGSDPAHGRWDVYRVRADGSGLTNVTRSKARHESEPAWNPTWAPDL